jgi:predicted PurR-regulated permease PerM
MLIYLLLYIFILKYISDTYTYLMVLIIGIFLGYVFADTAHRYLKKRDNNAQNI